MRKSRGEGEEEAGNSEDSVEGKRRQMRMRCWGENWKTHRKRLFKAEEEGAEAWVGTAAEVALQPPDVVGNLRTSTTEAVQGRSLLLQSGRQRSGSLRVASLVCRLPQQLDHQRHQLRLGLRPRRAWCRRPGCQRRQRLTGGQSEVGVGWGWLGNGWLMGVRGGLGAWAMGQGWGEGFGGGGGQ